jgi:hypothetical protein
MAYSKGTLAGDFIEGVISELDGVISVNVVEIVEELSMDTYSARENFDPDVATARMMEVLKAQQQTIKDLRLNETVKEIFVALESQVHLLTLSKSGKALFYIVADAQGTNLSIMRSVIRKYAKGI